MTQRAFTYGHQSKAKPPTPPILTIVEAHVHSRPWITRKFGECAWPVSGEGADTHSCCAPTSDSTYCPAHSRLAYAVPKGAWAKSGDELVRSLRRYA